MTTPSKESLAAAQGIDDYYDYGWTETRHNVVCEIIDRAFAEKMKAAQGLADELEKIWDQFLRYNAGIDSESETYIEEYIDGSDLDRIATSFRHWKELQ